MSGLVIALFLLIATVFFAGLSYYLFIRRKAYAIPTGTAVYGDLKSQGKILRSERYKLSGKPDMVIQRGKRIIPFEYKTTDANAPRGGHMLQMGVYFLILEELYPDREIRYGVLKYRNYAFRIENSPNLRVKLLDTLDKMRANTGVPARNHNNPRRCVYCSFRDNCSQRLIK